MKKIVIGVIVIMIISVVGVGAYFLINNMQEPGEEKNSTSEEHNTEKEESKKITKITAVKEMETSVAGKFTNKVEYTFENGKPVNLKYGVYDVKDKYIIETIKDGIKKMGGEKYCQTGENSFEFEFTGDVLDEYLESIKIKNIITRNYIVSEYKKSGYTVTIEGDDSFLGEENENSENTANESKSNEDINVGISSDTINKAMNEAQNYLNSEEVNNAKEKAQQKVQEYVNSEEMKKAQEEAKQKVQEYMNSEEMKKTQEEAEQRINEYIQNNQETIDAAKKQAEQMRKQYGF